jgi:hypothetical protein
MFDWEYGPEPDLDRWEENIVEQYEEYLERFTDGDSFPMCFEMYRDKMIQEMEEHIGSIEVDYYEEALT